MLGSIPNGASTMVLWFLWSLILYAIQLRYRGIPSKPSFSILPLSLLSQSRPPTLTLFQQKPVPSRRVVVSEQITQNALPKYHKSTLCRQTDLLLLNPSPIARTIHCTLSVHSLTSFEPENEYLRP